MSFSADENVAVHPDAMNFPHWSSNLEIKLDPDGKHSLNIPQDFPFALEYYDFSSMYRLTPSYHDYLEITYIYDGEGIFSVENKPYFVRKGDIILVGNERMHVLEAKPRQHSKVISIFFLPELIYKPGHESLSFDFIRLFYEQNPQELHIISADSENSRRIQQIIRQICEEIQKGKDYYMLAVKNLLCEILLITARHFSRYDKNNGRQAEKPNSIRRIEDVFSFIQNQFHRRMTNEELSETVHMSPAYLCRFFKSVTGMTLTDYILRFRIDKAKEILVKSDLSITQIAFEVGFESLNYFDRIFSRFTHMTPHQFRKKFGAEVHGEINYP